MERAEIKAIIKEILNEEYQGWKAPVLPGGAEKGSYLVANEDFIDPPLDISNKTKWYKPEEGNDPEPVPEDYVKSVNDKTPDADGNVELSASDIKANNTQSIQANLDRIDESVEGAIDDIADLNEVLSDMGDSIDGLESDMADKADKSNHQLLVFTLADDTTVNVDVVTVGA